MNRLNIVFIVAVISVVVGCGSNDDKKYFNGEIRCIDDSRVVTKNVISKPVQMDEVGMYMIAVYDSLFICWAPDFPDHFFDVFNVDTGKKIGSFCGKGRGHQEAMSVNCIFQLFKQGDDLMTSLYASNEGKLFYWNISQSIKQGKTVYDTVIPYGNNSVLFHFHLSKDTLLLFHDSQSLSFTKVTTPCYEKRTSYTNELIGKYSIYNVDSLEYNRTRYSLSDFFYTWDVMKPDGSKIVELMMYLPQINMIDTRTGETVGYRTKDGPDYSMMKADLQSRKRYYINAHADDKYIYAIYWGKEPWVDRVGVELPFFDTIHVFDWNGNLCYKLITDKSYLRVWRDEVRRRLYTINIDTGEVYYLDLDELNL